MSFVKYENRKNDPLVVITQHASDGILEEHYFPNEEQLTRANLVLNGGNRDIYAVYRQEDVMDANTLLCTAPKAYPDIACDIRAGIHLGPFVYDSCSGDDICTKCGCAWKNDQKALPVSMSETTYECPTTFICVHNAPAAATAFRHDSHEITSSSFVREEQQQHHVIDGRNGNVKGLHSKKRKRCPPAKKREEFIAIEEEEDSEMDDDLFCDENVLQKRTEQQQQPVDEDEQDADAHAVAVSPIKVVTKLSSASTDKKVTTTSGSGIATSIYDPLAYFEAYIDHREATDKPLHSSIIDDILMECTRRGIEITENTPTSVLREVMKYLRYNRLYPFIPQIMYRITGIPPIRLRPEERLMLLEQMKVIIKNWKRIVSHTSRKSMVRHSVIYQYLCELNGFESVERVLNSETKEKIMVNKKKLYDIQRKILDPAVARNLIPRVSSLAFSTTATTT